MRRGSKGRHQPAGLREVPPPGGPLGLVYQLAENEEGRLYLDHLAFGIRHQPSGSKAETVYQLADRRLNG